MKKVNRNTDIICAGEFSYSKFHQTMILPEDAEKDQISAYVEHGVLNISIPKIQINEEKNAKRMIEVK